MLWTVLSWFYITALCTSFGLAGKHALQYYFKSLQTLPLVLLPLLGLGQLTIIVTILSLFLSINEYTHGGILVVAALYVACDHRFVKQQFDQIIQKLTALPRSYWLIVSGLAVSLALLASLPDIYFPYDTGLYHAQAIQWIKEYNVVPGLANFHPQLGFNSSWFVINALFDSIVHSINGWLVFWCVLFFGRSAFGKNRPLVSSALSLTILVVIAVLSVFYMHPNQLTTASTDMPAALWLLLSVVLFVQYIEKSRDANDYWLIPALTMSVLLAITTKLSNTPVGLLLFYVFIQVMRQKNYRLSIAQVIVGIVVLLPWLVRNIILSGYLVYPAALGGELFSHFDWQVPISDVESMKQCIANWARYKSCAIATTAWLPQWLTELRRSTLLADSKIIIGVSLGYMMIAFAQWRQTIRVSWVTLWPVYGIGLLGLGFWFYSAPDVRFGLGFISLALVLLLLPASAALAKIISPKNSVSLLATLAIILLLAGGEYPLTTLTIKNLAKPSAYPIVEIEATQLNGHTVYDSATTSSTCWDKFPCTTRLNDIELRSSDVGNGFRIKSH